MLNTWTLNSRPLNGAGTVTVEDWTLVAPLERQTVYVLDIGELRLPISSAQATMRLSGQSFLQAVVPNADQYADALSSLVGETMILRGGYRYADGSFSPQEVLSACPLQTSSRATGPVNDTITLSGYAFKPTLTTTPGRALREVQARTIAQDGKRRVRCSIDLFLRPGHTAIDTDGTAFVVGTIQYFINATSEVMEVLQDA